MSNYDPFRIYSRSNKASNKGQVLRKKYYPFLGNTFTQVDIQRVIDSLEQRGYTISPPGTYISHTVSRDLLYMFSPGQVSIESIGESSFLPFESLWDSVFPELSSYFSVDPESVSNFVFAIDIISVTCYGDISLPNSNNGRVEISIAFDDLSKSLTLLHAPHGIQASSTVDSHFSLQSIDNLHALNTYSYDPSTTSDDSSASVSIKTKSQNTDSPTLFTYLETDPVLIPVLLSKNYEIYNPHLYTLTLGGTSPGPFTIANSVAAFHFHLQYDIK